MNFLKEIAREVLKGVLAGECGKDLQEYAESQMKKKEGAENEKNNNL